MISPHRAAEAVRVATAVKSNLSFEFAVLEVAGTGVIMPTGAGSRSALTGAAGLAAAAAAGGALFAASIFLLKPARSSPSPFFSMSSF